ncbi:MULTISPECIES: DUF6602 domain-containing protein [unclassified Pantoea]|uniref:DUF6602 domain-containing protein n=1 Tax=unclassified Pantoea TaxID=2630326 RepID=UPI00205E1DB9|nr:MULTISPECIES: DUF6602 domain-containing protein [unclassified Pantoea]MDU5474039.1 DUF6602 domain-containing protein [Pantoea sp.]DAI70375.1 MAG TPA: E protein [Bacteriophage sp.]
MSGKFLRTIMHNKIKQAYENAESVSQISHTTVKGTFREGFLIPLFQSLLPPHFGIGSGQIVDKWDRFSPQTDIIIYDKRQIPPIIEQNGLGVYFIDSVLRAVEVKSSLDTDGMHQTLNLAWALHPQNPLGLKTAKGGKLDKDEMYYPAVSCFSYKQSITDLNKALSKWQNQETIPPTMFCLPDSGLYNYVSEEKQFKKIPFLANRIDFTALYLALLLDRIEETAASRGGYSLLEWM